jgi:hypothetical protein
MVAGLAHIGFTRDVDKYWESLKINSDPKRIYVLSFVLLFFHAKCSLHFAQTCNDLIYHEDIESQSDLVHLLRTADSTRGLCA